MYNCVSFVVDVRLCLYGTCTTFMLNLLEIFRIEIVKSNLWVSFAVFGVAENCNYK